MSFSLVEDQVDNEDALRKFDGMTFAEEGGGVVDISVDSREASIVEGKS